MNPGNSAPGVAWLASDESMPITGQVFRLVGNNLCVYRPWEMGEQFFATDKEGNPQPLGPRQHRADPQQVPLPVDQPRHRRAAAAITPLESSVAQLPCASVSEVTGRNTTSSLPSGIVTFLLTDIEGSTGSGSAPRR